VEIEGPEPEPVALHDRPLEPRDDVAAPPLAAELHLQLPRLERLLDSLEPLERPLGLADLRAQRVRAAPVRAARPLPQRRAAPRLAAPRTEEPFELEAPLVRLLEPPVVLGPVALPCGLVCAPAAGVLERAAAALVQLDDPRHRPIQEIAVVRHDHRRAA
jgi:hypothetical protein